MLEYINKFERIVYAVLIILLVVVLVSAIAELVYLDMVVGRHGTAIGGC